MEDFPSRSLFPLFLHLFAQLRVGHVPTNCDYFVTVLISGLVRIDSDSHQNSFPRTSESNSGDLSNVAAVGQDTPPQRQSLHSRLDSASILSPLFFPRFQLLAAKTLSLPP